MYTYKYAIVEHSIWTGKPKENIELVIEEHASLGWRLVQILLVQSYSGNSGQKASKIIFEKQVPDDFYKGRGRLGLIDDDSFV